MTCHRNGEFLVDTCANMPGEPTFTVDIGEAVFLSVCGLPDGAVLPINHVMGSGADACETPLAENGSQMALSGATPQATITLPGTFTIDLSALGPDDCVKITARDIRIEDLGCCPPMEFPMPPVMPVPGDCTVESLTATFEGPGTFGSADLAAAGRIISAVVTAGGRTDAAVLVTGSNGVPMTLGCGDTKGWQEIYDHATQRYCTLADFEIELADGETACVVAQAMP